MKKKLFIFPYIDDSNNEHSHYYKPLFSALKSIIDVDYSYLSINDLINLSTIQPSPDSNTIFINWLDTLYIYFLPKYAALFIGFIPKIIRLYIIKVISDKLNNIFIRLKDRGYKIIFYFHDTECTSRMKTWREIDAFCRPFIYRNSNAVLFAEESSRDAIFKIYGQHKNTFISCLGPYNDYHGILPSRDRSRIDLNISPDSTVILALGNLRRNRQLYSFLFHINKFSDLFLICAGRGNKSIKKDNILSLSGYINNSDLIRYLASADYILNTGHNYLTSASLRVALSYEKPVIAENFGSTIDMCRDAVHIIDFSQHEDLNLNLSLNSLPRISSEEYNCLKKSAALRNQERSWTDAAYGLLDAINFVDLRF